MLSSLARASTLFLTQKKTHVARSSSCTIRFSARVSAAALFVFATRKLARAIIIGLLECATFFQLCCISRITIACECVYRALRVSCKPPTTTARTTSNNATTTLLGDERTASSSSGGSSVPRRVNTCASRVLKVVFPYKFTMSSFIAKNGLPFDPPFFLSLFFRVSYIFF